MTFGLLEQAGTLSSDSQLQPSDPGRLQSPTLNHPVPQPELLAEMQLNFQAAQGYLEGKEALSAFLVQFLVENA